MIDVILIVPTFILERNRLYVMPLAIYGVGSVVSILRVIRLRPLEKVEKSQAELDVIRRAEKKEKKAKHHNKPKNYH